MFGVVVCNKSELSEEEANRYQSFYCGLCKSLKNQFGQLERFTLNYDMTFLAIFLSSLYEPKEEQRKMRCAVHPKKEKMMLCNEYIDYAADMTIILSYFKCLDDWKDEHRLSGHCYGKLLQKKYKELEKKYPRQCKCVKDAIEKINKLEKDENAMADEIINASGKMLSELFVYKEDFWSLALRNFGYELGRFIYLMDAAIDYKKDIKKKNYNPLIKLEKQPKEAEEILAIIIGNATVEFEKMPIIQDEHLIRNILYSGVWLQYYDKVIGKEKQDDKSV